MLSFKFGFLLLLCLIGFYGFLLLFCLIGLYGFLLLHFWTLVNDFHIFIFWFRSHGRCWWAMQLFLGDLSIIFGNKGCTSTSHLIALDLLFWWNVLFNQRLLRLKRLKFGTYFRIEQYIFEVFLGQLVVLIFYCFLFFIFGRHYSIRFLLFDLLFLWWFAIRGCIISFFSFFCHYRRFLRLFLITL